MFILDKPYVSSYLVDTALKYGYPVLKNAAADELELNQELNFYCEGFAANQIKEGKDNLVYCNSENAIDWITKNLDSTDIPRQISLCKDKVQFRKLISKIYPDFYFEEIDTEALCGVDSSKLKFPVVLKPKIGFLSFGVYPIYNEKEWQNTIQTIKTDIEKYKEIFPKSVVNTSSFIIEEMIEGDEFAVDVYFDAENKPVILNIYKHPFSGSDDVSDRIYFTSKNIIKTYLEKFETLFEKIGCTMGLKNFPCHIELRVNDKAIIPIEINPMRFAGWCLCDLAHYAFDINPYVYYFEQKRPCWNDILSKMDDALYCFTIGDNQGIKDIKNIDYKAYSDDLISSNSAKYSAPSNKLFELRKIDYKNFPIFALAYIKLQDEDEVFKVLNMDFNKYIEV